MLLKRSDAQHKNVKTYLPYMAFAINMTNSSTLNCTPFEADQDLTTRIVTGPTRPKYKFNAEGAPETTPGKIFPHILTLASTKLY
jgi:hypothetical protein